MDTTLKVNVDSRDAKKSADDFRATLVDVGKQSKETEGAVARLNKEIKVTGEVTLAPSRQISGLALVIDELTQALKNNSTAAQKVATDNKSAWDTVVAGGKALAGIWATLKLADYIKDATLLAARNETLGVVMRVVGQNAGYTANEVDKAAASVAKMGITAIQSRESITRFIQAGLNLKDAPNLARVAQDAAVIAGTNSSEAFGSLIHGIQSAQVDVLRTIGINVNFEDSYKKLAKQLKVNADQLTENEKMQARFNSVMEAGTRISGVYEASLGTASKQIQSMKRYTEDAKVILGEVFNDTLTAATAAWTQHLKDSNAELKHLSDQGALKKWGEDIADVFATVADWLATAVTGLKAVGYTGSWLVDRIKIGLQNPIGNNKQEQREKADLQYDTNIGNLKGGVSTTFRDELAKMRGLRAADAAEEATRRREEDRDAAMADMMGVNRIKKDGKRGLSDAQLNKIKTFMDSFNELIKEREIQARGGTKLEIEISKLEAQGKKAGVGAAAMKPGLDRLRLADSEIKKREADKQLLEEMQANEEDLAKSQSERANAELKQYADFSRSQDLVLKNMRFELELSTQGATAQKQLTELRAVDLEVQKLSIDASAEQVDRLNALAETIKGKLKNAYADAKAAAGDWTNGALKAINDYKEQIDNVAGGTAQAFTTTFRSAEDVLVEFTKTGKLNFKSLIDTAIGEFARMAVVRPMMKQLMDLLDSFINKMKEAIGTSGASSGASGAGGFAGLIGGIGKWFSGSSTPDYLSLAGGDYGQFLANGGVMDARGMLRYYSSGGIASSPQVAVYGEGKKREAYVPLPDNRTIPVTLNDRSGGGMGAPQISIGVSVSANSDGTSRADVTAQNDGQNMGNIIAGMMSTWAQKELQPGGMIYKSIHGEN